MKRHTIEMKTMRKNSSSVFKPLAASNHSTVVREEHDFYATHPSAIDGLLSLIKLPKTILEPCCGSGCLSKRLKHFGHKVISEDLFDHGYGKMGIDFLEKKKLPKNCRTIVTNFPYRQVTEMTIHALDILPVGGILCSFVKTTFLEGQERYNNLFSKSPPKYIFQFVHRIPCATNGDFSIITGSAVSYAWLVWVKGYSGDPILKWINNSSYNFFKTDIRTLRCTG